MASHRGKTGSGARARAEDVTIVLGKRTQGDVPADVEQAIRATEDFDQLGRWLAVAAEVSSLPEFRRLAGLEAKRNGRRKRGK